VVRILGCGEVAIFGEKLARPTTVISWVAIFGAGGYFWGGWRGGGGRPCSDPWPWFTHDNYEGRVMGNFAIA
jgi:hypothetical protein